MRKNRSFLKLVFVVVFISTFYDKGTAQSSAPLAIDTLKNEKNSIILYEDKSWEYLSIVEKSNYLKEVVDTSSVFTNKWSSSIFPYKERGTPDSVYITYLSPLDSFVMPHIDRLNSPFGHRSDGFHKGIDIHLRRGAEIKSAFNGKVRYARYNYGGYGKLVIVRHFNGLETYYAHLNQINVTENQIIQAGEVLGLGGNTGAKWTGPHLHFEVRYHDFSFDPQKMISLADTTLIGEGILLKKSDFHSTIQASRKYHTIKSGETLGHIAMKYYGDWSGVQKIIKMNTSIKDETTPLKIGKKIRVK